MPKPEKLLSSLQVDPLLYIRILKFVYQTYPSFVLKFKLKFQILC